MQSTACKSFLVTFPGDEKSFEGDQNKENTCESLQKQKLGFSRSLHTDPAKADNRTGTIKTVGSKRIENKFIV